MSSFRRTAPIALTGGIAIAALAALIAVAADGGFSFGGGLEARLTGSSAAVLLAITVIGCIVVAFTARYSMDDPAPARLQWMMVGTIIAAGTVAVAGNLLTLTVGWIGSTVLLAALLAHRRDLAVAREGVARSLTSLAITDAMLLVAVAIIAAEAGNVGISEMGTVPGQLAQASVLGVDAGLITALLIVGAALGRCAQIPIGTWLPATLAAPTPVSALLHAGLVNAGALLLLALSPLVFDQPAAVWALFAVAAGTMLWGTTQMVVRPDVKGGLMLSTRGQMAFMLLQCAIGAFAAAFFHLIAHGMYKSYLFLASGNAIDERKKLAVAPASAIPPARGTRAVRQAVIALVLPAILLAAAVAILAPSLPDDSSGLVLLLFAFATGAQATWWWQRFREPRGITAAAGLLVLAGASGIYVELLYQAKELFAIAPIPSAVPAAALVPVLLLAMSASALQWAAAAGIGLGETHPRLRRLQLWAYAHALSAGTWAPRAGRREAAGSRRFAQETTPLEAR